MRPRWAYNRFALLNKVPPAVQKYKPRVAVRCKAMKQPGRRRKPDERIRRTHERLGTALPTLIQENIQGCVKFRSGFPRALFRGFDCFVYITLSIADTDRLPPASAKPVSSQTGGLA